MFASDSDAVEHARHGRLADLGLASSAPSSVQVARRPGGVARAGIPVLCGSQGLRERR